MNKPLINILLVDDHKLVRAGIRRILHEAKEIKVVGEAANGEEAIRLTGELKPDVVLMDLKMPGIGGIEATRKILHFHQEMKILVLTMCDDNLHPMRLLQCGACGYITKDTAPEDLLKAIHQISLGQRYVSPVLAQNMVLKNTLNEGQSPFEALSDRELQVALMVVQGIKTQDIAKKLNLSVKTINTYRYRIFKKMHLQNNDVELTRLAISFNLV